MEWGFRQRKSVREIVRKRKIMKKREKPKCGPVGDGKRCRYLNRREIKTAKRTALHLTCSRV